MSGLFTVCAATDEIVVFSCSSTVNTCTASSGVITFAAAHGIPNATTNSYSVQLAGFTPAAWNGTYEVVSSTTTTLTVNTRSGTTDATVTSGATVKSHQWPIAVGNLAQTGSGTSLIGTCTFSSAHGVATGSVTVLGIGTVTPSGWTGRWYGATAANTTAITFSMSTTVTTSTTTVPVTIRNWAGWATTSSTQSAGTLNVPQRAFTIVSEGFKLVPAIIESQGLSQQKVATALSLGHRGATGDLTMEVTALGFEWWMRHLMGTCNLEGGTSSGGTGYAYTATLDKLTGRGATVQLGRMSNQGVVYPFTYPGVKVTKWELSQKANGILTLKVTLFAQDEQVSVTLPASTSLIYGQSEGEPLSAMGGYLQLGNATAITSSPGYTNFGYVSDITLTVDNGLNTTRDMVRSTTVPGLPAEPLADKQRKITGQLTCEFVDLTYYNKYAATALSSSLISVVATWLAPTSLPGGSNKPGLTATLANVNLTGDTPTVSGAGLVMFNKKFEAYDTSRGANDALTLLYTCSNSTAW